MTAKFQFISWVIIVFSLGVFTSCADSENPQKPAESTELMEQNNDPKRFPNKRSELAILMRNLIDDLNENKAFVAGGKPTEVMWSEKYAGLLEAEPTDSNDSGPVFHGFGQKFLTDLKAFEEADSNNRIAAYDNLITSCVECHQQHCQGPIPAIEKLRL